jgi:biotin transporter BioY
MSIVNGVRVAVTLFCLGILGLAFVVAIDQLSDPMLPELPFINANSVLASLVVLILINLASL